MHVTQHPDVSHSTLRGKLINSAVACMTCTLISGSSQTKYLRSAGGSLVVSEPAILTLRLNVLLACLIK